MRRKAFGRDFGLSIRMGLALLPILGLYALAIFFAAAVLLIAIANGDAGAILGWLFLASCFGFVVYLHFVRGEGLALRVAGARELREDEENEVGSSFGAPRQPRTCRLRRYG